MDKPIDQGRETIRLPLYDAGVWRSPNANFGNYEQYYINCWAEKYHEPGSTQVAAETAVVPRPGLNAGGLSALSLATWASDSTGARWVTITNMAMVNLYDVYICAMFDTNGAGVPFIKILQYRPLAGTSQRICTIQQGSGAGAGLIDPGLNVTINDRVFITEIVNGNGLTPGIAFTWQGADKVTSAAAYALSVAGVFPGASSVQLTSGGGFAPYVASKILTGPFQQMNGNTYIMTQDGFIFNSSLNATGNPDIATWNSLATVAASQYPDNGIGIFRYKHLLLAVGTDSIEFFSPDNNAPPASPLVHTDQAFIKFGALNASLCKNVDDIFYWIAFGTGPTVGLWKLDGYTPVKISTPKEDQILSLAYTGGANLSYLTMEALIISNKRHICLNGVFPAYNYPTVPGASTNPPMALCFNVDDDVFWWLAMPAISGATEKIYAILPATAQPGLTPVAGTANVGAGFYTQYIFRRGGRPDLYNQQTAMEAQNVHQWSNVGTINALYDWFATSGTPGGSETPVVSYAGLRNYAFTNTKRKRFVRFSVQFDPFLASAPPALGNFTLQFTRENMVTPLTHPSPLKRLDGTNLSQSGVVVWNNLGAGRSFCPIISWNGGMRLQAAELDVEQWTT